MQRYLIALASVVPCKSQSLAAGDPNITYIGRTQAVDGGDARLFGWAGVQAVTRFTGSSISANIEVSSVKPGVRFLVEIDGAVSQKLVVPQGTMSSVQLADGLSGSETHTLSLWRISEDNTWNDLKGAAKFGGFSLPDGGEFLAAPEAKERRLEFWGDSNVAGWCADGTPSGSDDPQAGVQNTYETWAARLARDLGADFAAEAISGVGVTQKTAAGAMSSYIDGATTFSGSDWDYSSWTPNAVVFWLGLNDRHPSEHFAKFRTAYRQLMEHAAEKYAYATEKPKLIHVCGSLGDGSVDGCSDIQDAISNFNSGRKDGFESFYAPISPSVWKSVSSDKSLQGCDEHYNAKGHELVKSDLLSKMQDILGWGSTQDLVVV